MMRKSANYKKHISFILSVSLAAGSAFLLPGCGSASNQYLSSAEQKAQETIVLQEPVSLVESYAIAEYRTLYSSQIVSAICCPTVEEYAYDEGHSFDSYNKMPGDEVKSGDVILSGDTKQIDQQIKDKKTYIRDMETSHNEQMIDLNESYAEALAKENMLQGVLDQINSNKPEGEGAEFEASDVYQSWKMQLDHYTGEFAGATIERQKQELNITRTGKLYDLDHAYQQKLLSKLQADRNTATLSSKIDGTVVAIQVQYEKGNWIGKNTAVAAVGDLNKKQLRCEFINQGTIRLAQEIYAIVNGKRYEVEYEMLDGDTYDRIKKKNDVVYSTFNLIDPNDEVALGDYAAIVIIKDCRENTLCVPKDALGYEDSTDVVYLYQNGTYVPTPVRVGMKEGAYVEILSGLKEGDRVKSEFGIKTGKNTAKVEKGKISNSFSDHAWPYYPTSTQVKNPVTYGTVYLDELCVSDYQQVKKGDVIAKIHVVPDSVELQRMERQLTRAKERLQKLIDEDAEKNAREIKSRQKDIDELEKDINERKADSNTKEIISPSDGIVIECTRAKAGDLLQYETVVAQVADANQCYVLVEDKDGKLAYGNFATVSYKVSGGVSGSFDAMVATANPMCLSKDLTTGYALIRVPLESMALMSESTMTEDGWWYKTSFNVAVTLRSMDNVLLVPKKAVKEISGSTYVVVQDKDGANRIVSFVAGGSDNTNYWVVEGLTEGMTICLE